MAAFQNLTAIARPAAVALESFRDKKGAILNDSNLSADGKKSHLDGAAESVRRALNEAAPLLDKAQREAARKRESFSRPGFEAANVEQAILHSEIRQHLKSAKPADRTALLDGADANTLSAVLLAPCWLSGISSDLHDSLRLQYARLVHPDDYAALVEQEAAIAAITAHLSAIAEELPV